LRDAAALAELRARRCPVDGSPLVAYAASMFVGTAERYECGHRFTHGLQHLIAPRDPQECRLTLHERVLAILRSRGLV
jgi:hypothetical protein